MRTPHMPNMRNPIAGQGGELATPWAKFLQELLKTAGLDQAPGYIQMFEPAEADLADPLKFVQAGATQGLGVGDFLGWAHCNGNNGTSDRVAEFAAFTTLVPLLKVG